MKKIISHFLLILLIIIFITPVIAEKETALITKSTGNIDESFSETAFSYLREALEKKGFNLIPDKALQKTIKKLKSLSFFDEADRARTIAEKHYLTEVFTGVISGDNNGIN
ncbi:MAG: hypothetical protein KAS39_02460, partial [Actinomycetia bacterium]|nr:hypothetical protein [Actinomycetes bacterium]